MTPSLRRSPSATRNGNNAGRICAHGYSTRRDFGLIGKSSTPPRSAISARPRRRSRTAPMTDLHPSRWRLAEGQGWRCCYCGCRMEPAIHNRPSPFAVTRDHIIPRNEGGIRSWDNLVAACSLCNCYRRSMDAMTFWIFASGRWSPDLGKKSLSGLLAYARARRNRGDPIKPASQLR